MSKELSIEERIYTLFEIPILLNMISAKLNELLNDTESESNVSKPKIKADSLSDFTDNTFNHDVNDDKCRFHNAYLMSGCPVCHQNQRDMMFVELYPQNNTQEKEAGK